MVFGFMHLKIRVRIWRIWGFHVSKSIRGIPSAELHDFRNYLKIITLSIARLLDFLEMSAYI